MNNAPHKELTKSYEDLRTPQAMCGFDPGVGSPEAFDYISLSRATLEDDHVALYFGAATVRVFFRELGTRASRDQRERCEFFRALLNHSVGWVQVGGDLVARIEIELKPEDEISDVEVEETNVEEE